MSKPERTVIEIAQGCRKILRGRKTGGTWVAVSCALEETGLSLPSGERADSLRGRDSQRGEWFVIVPRSRVILRPMTLPARNDTEIMDMIGLQLINHIPYPVEEVIYQYQTLDQNDEGYSRVLVTVLPKNVSREYAARVPAKKTRDVKVILSSHGIAAWASNNEWCRQAGAEKTVAVIDIDQQHAEICFCRRNKMYFSRHLPFGRRDLARQGPRRLIEQVLLSLKIYSGQRLGPDAGSVGILLEFEEGNILKEQLERALEIPVRILKMRDGTRARPAVEQALRSHGGHSFTAGLGLLVSDAKHWANLVPAEVKQAERQRVQGRQLARLIILLCVTAGLSVSGRGMDIYAKSRQLAALKEEHLQLRARADEARKKISLVEYFDRRHAEDHFVPDIMEELRLVVPDGITLRTFSMNDERSIDIQGYAAAQADINALQAGLIQSSRFHSVDLKSATNRKVANANMVDFKIAARLGRPEEERP